MTLFHRQFDVVGVKLAATDDDQVLQATGDEQFAIFQKPEIPGTEKWPFTGILQVGSTSTFRVLGSVPIPLGHAWARHPNLADLIRRTRGQRFRMSYDNSGVVQGMATADECPHILLLGAGLHDTIVLECRHV